MISVNIHQAKTHLSRLLKRVLLGEEVVFAKAGKPVARLVPYREADAARVPGQDRGRLHVPEDFDEPLPPDVLRAFEG